VSGRRRARLSSSLFERLNLERLFTSAMAVGQGDYVLSRAAEYAKVRPPFNAPIGSYQSIQHLRFVKLCGPTCVMNFGPTLA
jgi:Acyl-CoA dehydrogenase, C-terminal domain